MPDEGHKRWCAVCAKAHEGALILRRKCETCKEQLPSYGLPGQTMRRWCAKCAKSQDGAVCMKKKKMCETCKGRTVSLQGFLSLLC